MADALRLYLRYLGLSLRGQLAYRASFALKTIGQLLVTAIEFFGIWALFARFGSLAGWTLPEVALIYGIADTAFALSDGVGRGFDLFGQVLKEGEFDRMLVRPRSTVLQLFGFDFRLRSLGRLAQALVVLGWAGRAVAWTPASVAVLGLAIVGSACVHVGLVVLQATSAFWTIESLEVWNAFTYGGNYASQYPMSIYQRWLRRFFIAVVPLALATYAPARAILGRAPLDIGHALAPLVGFGFLALSLAVWRLGIRHHASTGS